MTAAIAIAIRSDVEKTVADADLVAALSDYRVLEHSGSGPGND